MWAMDGIESALRDIEGTEDLLEKGLKIAGIEKEINDLKAGVSGEIRCKR